jgi:hypothetical protein
MRLFVCLTAAGGTIVIAGLATGLAGEASRLTGGRGWHGIVLAAEMLLAVGLSCGTLLVVAVAWWQLSDRWRLRADLRPRTATGGHTGAAAAASAQQKMTQIKDLYREAEAMTDAELSAHWAELRQRQHELIRQYFVQAGFGGAAFGQSPRHARKRRRARDGVPASGGARPAGRALRPAGRSFRAAMSAALHPRG